jgi:hypothetical protein
MCAAYMMYGVVSVAPSYLFTSHTHTLYREREREREDFWKKLKIVILEEIYIHMSHFSQNNSVWKCVLGGVAVGTVR